MQQAPFFYQGVDAANSKFDVNKDVVDGKLVKEDEISSDDEAEKDAAEEEKEAVEADAGGDEVVVEDVEQKAA